MVAHDAATIASITWPCQYTCLAKAQPGLPSSGGEQFFTSTWRSKQIPYSTRKSCNGRTASAQAVLTRSCPSKSHGIRNEGAEIETTRGLCNDRCANDHAIIASSCARNEPKRTIAAFAIDDRSDPGEPEREAKDHARFASSSSWNSPCPETSHCIGTGTSSTSCKASLAKDHAELARSWHQAT